MCHIIFPIQTFCRVTRVFISITHAEWTRKELKIFNFIRTKSNMKLQLLGLITFFTPIITYVKQFPPVLWIFKIKFSLYKHNTWEVGQIKISNLEWTTWKIRWYCRIYDHISFFTPNDVCVLSLVLWKRTFSI